MIIIIDQRSTIIQLCFVSNLPGFGTLSFLGAADVDEGQQECDEESHASGHNLRWDQEAGPTLRKLTGAAYRHNT